MLAATLSRGGSYQRLGPDEREAIHRPIDISWGATMPGGFAEGSIRLPFSDLDHWQLADARVYDSDCETTYSGRVEGVDREGDTISLNLAGWWAHAGDDQTARALIVDRDLSRWGSVSAPTRIALLGTYGAVHDPTTRPAVASGIPELVTGWSGAWNARPIGVAFLDGELAIASIYYEGIDSGGLNTGDPGVDVFLQVSPTDDGSGGTVSADLWASSWSGTFTPTTPARFVYISVAYNVAGAAGADGTDYTVSWRRLAAYGDHGLTKRGTEPEAGYYGSDVITYLLNTFAPQLSTESVDIEESTLALLHLTWLEETTAQAMTAEVAPLSFRGSDVPDYGVYEDKRFFLKAPGWGRTWRVRLDQGVSFDDEGIDSAEVCNGAVVVYSDAAGTSKRVGPVGSGADDEDDVLADDDPANAVNAAGIERKWIKVSAGLTTLAGATLIGQVAMRQANSLGRRGEVKLSEIIPDDHGILFPSHLVRAGDMLAIEDDEVVVTYPVRSMNRSADGGVSAAIGVDPDRVSVLLARLGVNQSVLNF